MSTPSLSDGPTGYLHTPTYNGASRKRKAEEILPYPFYSNQRSPIQPAVISSSTTPTNPISPISQFELLPQSNGAAFSSRIQQTTNIHFHNSETSTALPFGSHPIMHHRDVTDISRSIDPTSDCNSSRHESSTRSVTESDWSETEDIDQEIQNATDQISQTVEARKWLYFIDHQLHKILQGLAQIEGAAAQVARATNSASMFPGNIYPLKDQIMLFYLCQQHRVEETFGEQAFLRSKLRELQERSEAQVQGISNLCRHSTCRPQEEINTSICRASFRG